jgi:hypothetical protein
MMHPTVVMSLAAERHADLLRAAEARRRATLVARDRETFVSRGSDGLRAALTALRARVASATERRDERPAELCCA